MNSLNKAQVRRSAPVVITTRDSISKVADTIQGLCVENKQLQRKLNGLTTGRKTIVLTAEEMELMEAAPRASKQLLKIASLIEQQIGRGTILRTELPIVRECREEAAALARLDECRKSLEREGAIFLVS